MIILSARLSKTQPYFKITSKDTKDDELTEEEANDRFFRQHNIGHEDWAIRKSPKNAKYRAL